jgi:hypothetical protein
MDIPISFIWIIILFNAVFKYGDGAKFWGYVGINAEPLCVEDSNLHTHRRENLKSYTLCRIL